MTNLISDALDLLNIKDWGMRGIPTNEKEFNAMFFKITGEDKSGSAIESSDTSNFGVTWSEVQTALADGGLVAMTELRKQRDALLKETDWMASSDYTMSNAWKTYRQALRDLPANNKNASWDGITLDNVSFPTKPS